MPTPTLDITPALHEGIPVCSKDKCSCFSSRVESGWGIYQTCYRWTEEKFGKKPHCWDKALCKPFVAAAGVKL